MSSKPTLTLTLREAFLLAFDRAEKTQRTQQIELNPNLYARINVQGTRRFLLFQLEGTPTETWAHTLAEVVRFRSYTLDWFQGESLMSLIVQEIPEEN